MSKGQGFGQRPVKQTQYVIEYEKTEEFLVAMELSADVAMFKWSTSPAQAKVYRQLDAAKEAAKCLVEEKQARFWICSRKDMGQQWGVVREFVVSSSPDDSDMEWQALP